MRNMVLCIMQNSFFGNLLSIVFDSNKYLYWVQNSSFVQMKSGQKVETLTSDERKEKLNNFIEKVNRGVADASIAIGYPASEEKEYATTSGQVSNLFFQPLWRIYIIHGLVRR